MNISCDISSTDELNSFNCSACNDTEKDNYLEMVLAVDIITLLVSFPINFYVIWLIVRGTGNGLAAEFLLLNFSVCKILLCLESFCGILNYISKVISRVEIFLDGLASTGCPLFESLMCVERYLAVVHPITFLKYKPLRYKVICSVVAWITSFSSCILTFMTSFFSLRWLYFTSYVAQFFIFLSIQLFCCLAVLRALKQSGPGERGREKEEENHMKRRAFYLILITAVTTVIIYAPYVIFTILDETSDLCTNIFETIGNICFLFVGLVQPLLFLYRVGKLNFFNC